ncbi:MAG TPA: serine protease [Verrucomicrobiae bacterium]|jgi:S1-C subfamily serine protease|nr:serine protease [Verrucomicrobiae bacterium]
MKLPLAAVAAIILASIPAGCVTRNSDDAVIAAVGALEPSVVLLTMRVPAEHKSDPYDDAYASGIVVASGPWGSDVLTVQHAIDGAWNLRVTIDNKRRVPGRVVAQDTDLDVALVRTAVPDLPVVRLGSSAHLADRVGAVIGLIGYPIPDEFNDEALGLATSLNTGRLSSLRKHALEVTLPIVPGESGGPVFLADTGEIVGIAESRFDDERSIGFALPIDDARLFLHRHDAEHGF